MKNQKKTKIRKKKREAKNWKRRNFKNETQQPSEKRRYTHIEKQFTKPIFFLKETQATSDKKDK